MTNHPDLPPLLRSFIAQLCSEEFLRRWEKVGADYAQVDVILYGTKGKVIPTLPPAIVLHTG